MDNSFLCFRNLHAVPLKFIAKEYCSWDGNGSEVPYFETISIFLPPLLLSQVAASLEPCRDQVSFRVRIKERGRKRKP